MVSPDRIDSGDTLKGGDQLLPAGPLVAQNSAAGGGELVVPATPLAGLLDPFPLDPAPALHAIEHRVERGDVKSEDAAGAIVDQLRDLVAMAAACFERRHDHQLGGATFELVLWRHILPDNIWRDP